MQSLERIEKKYQIFISSTYEDLREEREAVIKTILSLNHIPIGMEMFNASNDEQWKVIQKTIDASDYYVLIIGFKYSTGFTEKEYDYAKKQNIPILTFIKDENAPSIPMQRETTPELQKKLDKFRKKAKGKTSKFWKEKNELTTFLSTSLQAEMQNHPRIGWIRTYATPVAIENVISEWGLEHIFRSRAEKNTEADSKLREPKIKMLDGMAFGLKTFRSAHTGDIEKCLREGMVFRLLTMDPHGNFIRQREKEENEVEGQMKKSITELVEWGKSLKEKTKGNISIKCYNSMTLDFYWRIDNTLYVGPYLYKRASQATLTYKYTNPGKGFDEYTRYFDDLWNDSSLTTPLL